MYITVIVLLANGDPIDSLTSITQSIVAGQQHIGSRVTILSYGLDTGELIVAEVESKNYISFGSVYAYHSAISVTAELLICQLIQWLSSCFHFF